MSTMTLPARDRLPWILLALVLSIGSAFQFRLVTSDGASSLSEPQRRTTRAVAHGAGAADRAFSDTISVQVTAGDPLITTLPPTVGGQPVERYRLVDGPTLSSVAGRSLLWVTRPDDAGTRRLSISAEGTSPPETLYVDIRVEK